MDAYHIHIPFAEDELRALRILGEVEGKEVAALFEDGGIAAVEVFGPLVRKVPAPKGDDPSPQVDDGEDDPVPESIVAAAFFAGAHQGGGNHFLIGEALFPQVVPQVVPAFRGVADAEPHHRGFGKAPVHQVFPGLPAPLGHKVLVEVPGGGAVQLQYPCLSLAAAVVHRPFRDSHPGPLRQTPHRLHIVQVLNLLHKGDGVPTGPAAEAVEGLCIRVDGEGGGLFRVEGAEPGEVLAPPPQLDIPPNHLLDVGVVLQFVEEGLRQHVTTPFRVRCSCLLCCLRRRHQQKGLLCAGPTSLAIGTKHPSAVHRP